MPNHSQYFKLLELLKKESLIKVINL